MNSKKLNAKPSEKSFTLLETVIALGMMVVFLAALAETQGNAVYFSEFERNSTKATWLAKSVMSKIEYYWQTRDFSEMTMSEKEIPFEVDKDFTYSYEIKEWKLPLINMLLGGGGEEGEGGDPQANYIMQLAKKFLGDEILKTAHVEVFWPEGAKKNSVTLTLLLTNQRQLDTSIEGLKPLKKETGKKDPKKDPKNQQGKKDPKKDPKNQKGKTPPGNPPTDADGEDPDEDY